MNCTSFDKAMDKATEAYEFCRALIRCGIPFDDVAITFTRLTPHPNLRGLEHHAYSEHVRHLSKSLGAP